MWEVEEVVLEEEVLEEEVLEEEGDEEVGEVAVAVPDLIKEVKHECRSIKFTISVSYMCTRVSCEY